MALIWEGLTEAVRLLAGRDPAVWRIGLLSVLVSGAATVLAALAGVPLGAALALRQFRGQRFVAAIVNTGMGLPPVVVGLAVAMLLWRSGRWKRKTV